MVPVTRLAGRTHFAKVKNAVSKLPYNVQSWAEKEAKPTACAQERAEFVEHVLHNQVARTWEGELNFQATV